MFACVKVPKNLCEYRLFRGAADFGNLKQWDLYEKGYSFLTVVSVPEFIRLLTKQSTSVANIRNIATRLLNNFVYILEHEFRGLTGISGLTTDSTTITDGISELQMINKVVEDTSVQISMSFFEKSGRPITKFAEFFLRGIKDSRTQGKTYWGLIETGTIEPGFDKEVFSLLYYVTDNTYRNLEGAYLFMCAQLTEVPLADVFESEKGQYSNPEITLTFNAFPVTGDDVNYEAARLLAFLLSDDAGDDRLIVDTQSITGFYTGVSDIQNSFGISASKYGKGEAKNYTDTYTNEAGKISPGSAYNPGKYDPTSNKSYQW